MKSRIILLIIFFTFLFACQKATEVVNTEIVVGENDNMTIIQYDTVIIGDYNSPVNFNIDLNNDGVDDIQFECEEQGSQYVGLLPWSKINVLNNNIGVFGQSAIDTNFLNITSYININADSSLLINTYYRYTCNRRDIADQIQNITPSSQIIPLSNSDTIDISDNYIIDSVYIAETGATWLWKEENHGDTTIRYFKATSDDCFIAFPLETESFIGVMFLNEKKLGWIKFNLLSKNKIKILESGVQK